MRKILLFVLAALMMSCESGWNRGECPVYLSFSEDYQMLVTSLLTKGDDMVLPDTNDFILSIVESESGDILFEGLYGDRPSKLLLVEGNYLFGVYSTEFDAPTFSTPLFGDQQRVSVDGSGVTISFRCAQLNSGVKLSFDEKFRNHFSGSEMVLRQDENRLEYPFTESRTAYFNSGKVEIVLVTGESERQILSRNLEGGVVLTVNFSVDLSEGCDADYHIAVDTARVWIVEDYIYGKERDGSIKSRSLNVSDVENMAGSEDVWVKGYIVGGDLTSSSASYTAPFTSRTNILISDLPSVISREGCASVELKSGTIRDELNLVDHATFLGEMVYVKGDIVESYFGLPGIKSLSEYSFN